MIRANAIDHINMSVENLDTSVDFYSSIFGFSLKEEGNSEGERWKIIGSQAIFLCLYETADIKPRDKDCLQINHFGFQVDDLVLAEKELREMGVEILYDKIIDWGKSKSLYFKDPSGYAIELSKCFGGNL